MASNILGGILLSFWRVTPHRLKRFTAALLLLAYKSDQITP